MILITFFIAVVLLFYLDKTQKKIFFLPILPFLFFYSISFVLQDNKQLSEKIFIFDKPRLEIEAYLLYYISVIALISAVLIVNYLSCLSGKVKYYTCEYNYKRLIYIYYICSFFSLLGCIINIYRVISSSSLSLLFVDPRGYEELFGASSVINYLYFLNVPALCISVFCALKNVKVRFSVILNFLLVVISFFHGIKFTIFDTIMYPAILFYMLRKSNSLKPMFFMGASLVTVFMLFSVFVRGGQANNPIVSFLSYIIPNYYNLAYNVETAPFQFGDISLLYWPDKFFNPSSIIRTGGNLNGQFVLNDSYNMYTSLVSLFAALNFLGPFFYIVIFIIQYYFYTRRNVTFFNAFMSSYFFFCMLFSFYFYAYTKFKNVYLIGVLLLIDLLCRKRAES